MRVGFEEDEEEEEVDENEWVTFEELILEVIFSDPRAWKALFVLWCALYRSERLGIES